MNYGIVCGPKLVETLPTTLTQSSQSKILFSKDYVYSDIDDLREHLYSGSPRVFDSMNAILILDYAFKDATDERSSLEEFIALQDVMNTLRLTKVKLYLVTTNSDLYFTIKEGYSGYEGIIYPNTEVFLVRDGIKVRYLVSVLSGTEDGRGYFKVFRKQLTRVEQYEQDRKQLEEDTRQVSDSVLEFEKDIPSSVLSESDYADSGAALRKQKDLLTGDSTDGIQKKPATPVAPVKKADYVTNINIKSVNKPTQDVTPQEISGIEELKMLFSRLLQDTMTLTDEKLLTDRGTTILFSGQKQSGVSGLVAQTAEVYAMLGLKVAILDLDIDTRMQTTYFPNFDDVIAGGNGISNALLNSFGGGNLAKIGVPVTSRITVAGLSRSFEGVDDTFKKTIHYSLEGVCEDALNPEIGGFDIVLIDCPFDDLVTYINNTGKIDRFIFVVDSKHYSLEHFLSNKLVNLEGDGNLMAREVFKKSTIILNKVLPNNRNELGVVTDQSYVKNLLLQAGTPYDGIFVAGEIPFYDEWEEQFLTNKRYVWKNDVFLGLLKNILKEAV